MVTRLILTSALLLSGCAGDDAYFAAVKGRDDLVQYVIDTKIDSGLSDELTVPVPDGVQSMLIEVRGNKGRYSLAQFTTPAGDNLIDGARFMTKFAREIDGLVDWLYPNTPTLSLQAGEYRLILRDQNPDGSRADEDIQVRVYFKKRKNIENCEIKLDFLVDEAAIGTAELPQKLGAAVSWVNRLYDQSKVGFRIGDYAPTAITLPTTKFDVDHTETIMSQVDDVLRQQTQAGNARHDTVHVVVVKAIVLSTDPDAEPLRPSGYSMGLPGPLDWDRPNAAVLISTDAYGGSTGDLDVEGMASTIAHEVGHYLGLFHTTEKMPGGWKNEWDPLDDTPRCVDGKCDVGFYTNIMTPGGGSIRTTLTQDQAFVMRNHPLCMPSQPPELPMCTLACGPPETCSVVGGDMACRPACDPRTPACTSGTCKPDDIGTNICAP